MAYDYKPTTWKNGQTALNETNLNKIEEAIDRIAEEASQPKTRTYLFSCEDTINNLKVSGQGGRLWVYDFDSNDYTVGHYGDLMSGKYDNWKVINDQLKNPTNISCLVDNYWIIVKQGDISDYYYLTPIYYNGKHYFEIGDIFRSSNRNTPDWIVRNGITGSIFQPVHSNITSIENGTGTKSIQTVQDGTSGTFDFTGKNPNATKLDSSLTGYIAYGAIGECATSFGGKSQASGKRSLAQGTTTIAKGAYSHAEGDNCVAYGNDSHAEGYATTSYGVASHSEGRDTVAKAENSHAEGVKNEIVEDAIGAHAEGAYNTANTRHSHVGGLHNTTNAVGQTVIGYCNDAKENTLFEVGNGTFDEGHKVLTRKNAFEVYMDGHAEIQKVGWQENSVVNKAYVATVEAAVNNSINAVDSTLKAEIHKQIDKIINTYLPLKSDATNLTNGSKGETNHELYPFENVQGGKDSKASYDGNFVFGTGLRNTMENQAVFGKYNDNSNWEPNRPLLMVGNGDSDSERKNAFEVYLDGHAEVQTMGTTNNSVATKAYVDAHGVDVERLEEEITDLKNALYGSVLDVQPQTYDNVGVAVMDRANGYPIVDNQKSKLESIKGKSLVVNQLIKNYDFSTNTDWSFIGVEPVWGTNKITLSTTRTGNEWSVIYQNRPTGNEFVSGNKYFFSIKCSKSSNLKMRIRYPAIVNLEENEYIFVANQELQSLYIQFQSTDGQEASVEITQIKVVDLNKAFASQTLPTTIEEFKRLTRNIDVETYNKGTPVSVNITTLKSNPFNLFDEELEEGLILNDGNINPNQYHRVSKNFIKVFGGYEYTLNTGYESINLRLLQFDKNKNPIGNVIEAYNCNFYVVRLVDNACYVKFSIGSIDGRTKLSEPCFHLTGDGSMNGVYKPYREPETVTLSTGDLNGINEAVDEITETTKTRVIGKVDLETLVFKKSGNHFYATAPQGIKLPSLNNETANIFCTAFETTNANNVNSETLDKSIALSYGGSIVIYTSELANYDEETFNQKMQGKILYYELATPIIEEGFGEILIHVEVGGSIETDSNADITLNHVVYKPLEE